MNLPNVCTCCTACCTPLTTSTVMAKSPYSVWRSLAARSVRPALTAAGPLND